MCIRDSSCSHCSDHFRWYSQLKTHLLKSHNEGTWFTCDICQKKFSRSGHRKEHLLQHKQVKSYVCSECPRRFCSAAALKSHQLIHSSLQQFSCGKCGKYFKHKHNVVCHFERCSDDRLGIISLFNPRVCNNRVHSCAPLS